MKMKERWALTYGGYACQSMVIVRVIPLTKEEQGYYNKYYTEEEKTMLHRIVEGSKTMDVSVAESSPIVRNVLRRGLDGILIKTRKRNFRYITDKEKQAILKVAVAEDTKYRTDIFKILTGNGGR